MVIDTSCHNKPKYWDRQARANNADPDQMMQTATGDQDLHCLTFIWQFVYTLIGSRIELFKILWVSMARS